MRKAGNQEGNSCLPVFLIAVAVPGAASGARVGLRRFLHTGFICGTLE
jgi:hypothetical protein